MLELVDLPLEVCGSTSIRLTANWRTGGNSWFAPRFGFVCDNIANFEVGILIPRFICPKLKCYRLYLAPAKL